ncbi:hypothetical protein Amsp01_089770 [Amycolatopsis sp. NBRC 101858]|uniref:hypothetical protein n=1 Tax=Amycolatopsis sp. NBRC 101858 TaxID=3032200 RepID=UPI0024A38AF7|nr:hypothetical protein [Amycolatopsis sp. NBRC 101858]GLY42954.1 hypothetical protein Amsp01_089770 [Amycolatopsis sp. NBRC 101858]
MTEPNEQPEIARPATPDPGRTGRDALYDPGEGEPAENVEDAEGAGQQVIAEQRERGRD